jgi:membrane fusion protein, heavy metal efflux system
MITGKQFNFIIISLMMISISPVYAETDGHNHEENKAVKHDEHDDKEKQDDHDEHFDEKKHDDHDEHGDEKKHDDHDEHDDEEKQNDQDKHEASDDDDHGHEAAALVKLSPAQQQMAGIKVNTVKASHNLKQVISAPGEVVNDLYNTTLLSTQVNSKVLRRHVILGQHVNQGDVIAILYSLDIATVQNQLKVSIAEWQRVKKLGKKMVGEKRYIEAKAAFAKDKSLLLAYGFNEKLLQQFLSGKNTYNSGEYPIMAPHKGVILEDNFQTGQFLIAGSTIARLVNEEQVWVEALLAPELGHSIPVGTSAKVIIGTHSFDAKVIHDSHAIDEVTRTRKLRLNINNKNHLLHAGHFATVHIELSLTESIILLPESALMRSADGDWTVFIEEKPGVFKQEEVEIEKTINGLHSIKGLNSGEKVAITGAFFLASEIAKGGFDPHNH